MPAPSSRALSGGLLQLKASKKHLLEIAADLRKDGSSRKDYEEPLKHWVDRLKCNKITGTSHGRRFLRDLGFIFWRLSGLVLLFSPQKHTNLQVPIYVRSGTKEYFRKSVVSSYHYFGSASFGKVVEGHDMKVKGIENLHVTWF